MAENISELLVEIQELVGKLETIAFSDADSVSYKGSVRPTIAAELDTRINFLQTLVQGRSPFESKTALDASGAPALDNNGNFTLAEVWNDGDANNNGIYGYSGSAWVKSTHELFSFQARLSEKLSVEDFIKIAPVSPNLFNALDPDCVADRYVNSGSGNLQTPEGDPADYSVTGYISVIPGNVYIRSSAAQMAFYDANKQYVSGRSGLNDPAITDSFTVPAGCFFARLSIKKGYKDSFQFEAGPTLSPYQAYGYAIDFTNIPAKSVSEQYLGDGSVTPKKTSFFEQTKNLFDINAGDVILGSYINSGSGNPIANASYNATGYIAVVPGATYTASYSHQRAFYSPLKNYVSGESSGSPATFIVPAGCFFVRLTVAPFAWTEFQLELGEVATDWVEFGYFITRDVLPSPPPISRLDEFLTDAGAPKLNPFRPELLRRTHLKLMKRSLPAQESAQLIINVAGDSYSHNRARWIQGFTEYLADRFGDAGGGWCGFGFLNAGNIAPWSVGNQPSYLNGNARSVYKTSVTGNVSGDYYNGPSPDLAFATLSASGDSVVQSFPATPAHDACDLLFIGTADGVVRYTWDGGVTWQPLNVQGGVGDTQSISISTGIAGNDGELTIEWVSGIAELCGVNLKSSAPGVRVNKLAATGSKISHWSAAPSVQFEEGLSALSPDLFIYMDGTNSQSVGISANDWGSHLETLFDRIVSATPGVDVLFLTPPENQRVGNAVLMSDYATAARAVALRRRFTFNDTQDAFGDSTNPGEYASDGVLPLFSADLIHPEPSTGGRVLMSEVLKCVLKW